MKNIRLIKNSNILLLCLSFFIIVSCNETANNNSTEENINTNDSMNESLEDRVMKVVTELPEYYDAAVHVKAMTNGEQSLSSIIEAPNADHSEYFIQVGYNQETWFETYYFFCVNPENLEIFIEDVIEGDVVSIETWRKRESNR